MRKRSWDFEVRIPERHHQAVLRSILAGEQTLRVEGEHVNALLCALPKSASLHTTQLLAKALGMENHPVGFNRAGGQAYYPRLVLAKFRGTHTISHCHNPPDAFTVKAIRELGLRPIVLTRNLLDALQSRRDMMVRDRRAGGMLAERAIARFLAADDEAQLDTAIELFAGTFLNFAASWFEHRNGSELDPIFLTFEEMRADEPGSVERVARHLGLRFDAERTRAVIDGIAREGGINRSKDASRRGPATFSARQIDRLRELALTIGCEDETFLGFSGSPGLRASALPDRTG